LLFVDANIVMMKVENVTEHMAHFNLSKLLD